MAHEARYDVEFSLANASQINRNGLSFTVLKECDELEHFDSSFDPALEKMDPGGSRWDPESGLANNRTLGLCGKIELGD